MKLSVRRYIDAADVMVLLPSSRLSSSASRYRTRTCTVLGLPVFCLTARTAAQYGSQYPALLMPVGSCR